MNSFLGIWNNIPQQVKPQQKQIRQQYKAQYTNYDYSTASTHDWSHVKNFDSSFFKMQSAENLPKSKDFNNYNGFYKKLSNPDFDMPVARLNLIG